jgi:hypothetical protein
MHLPLTMPHIPDQKIWYKLQCKDGGFQCKHLCALP